MQEYLPSLDSHDESYFASFTDMLVGIIFIFIILLMIVANNYQEATEEVIQTNQALVDARNKIRDEARDKDHDEAQGKEIAKLKALAEAKTMEVAKALEEIKVLEAAKALQEAKAREEATAVQNTKTIEDPKATTAAKANDDVAMRRLTDTQQNIFIDSRAKVLKKIQETMHMQGFDITTDINQGTLLVPENILFDANWNQGEVNYRGKQTAYTLATLLGKYLPCISPTADTSRLLDCNGLGITPNSGLDVIFIDDYPDANVSRENKLLLSVERTVALFNELKHDEPYLDKELKNVAGVPILDIKVNQERRKAWKQEQDNPTLRKFVVLRFIMRRPNQADILKLRNSKDTKNLSQ